MAMEHVYISYPDFRMFDVIDSEQFDVNNNELQSKINELIDNLNKVFDIDEEATSGADSLTVNPVAPFEEAVKLQDLLEQLIDRLKSEIPGESGSELIGASPIVGLSGNSIHQQIVSLEALLREARATVTRLNNSVASIDLKVKSMDNTVTNHNHDGRYYTRAEIDNIIDSNKATVHVDVMTVTSIGSNTFTYKDQKGITQTGSFSANGFEFRLNNKYEMSANQLSATLNSNTVLEVITGEITELSPEQVRINKQLVIGDEVVFRYFERISLIGEYAIYYGQEQPQTSSTAMMWYQLLD